MTSTSLSDYPSGTQSKGESSDFCLLDHFKRVASGKIHGACFNVLVLCIACGWHLGPLHLTLTSPPKCLGEYYSCPREDILSPEEMSNGREDCQMRRQAEGELEQVNGLTIPTPDQV